jgi:hypothetical protein
MPQLGAIGDLLVSFQQGGAGVTVLFTRMADGVTQYSFPYPGAPGFFSSPVTVRDRVYGFLAGALWEYCLFDGAGFKNFPLPNFTPSPDCRPIHVATPQDDLLFMGASNAVWKVNVTGPQPAHLSYAVRLSPGDTIQSPVHVPGWGVVFTTRLGKIIVFPETEGNLGAAPTVYGLRNCPCLLSAPAVAPGAAGIVAELFEGDTLTRFFLTIGPNMRMMKRPTGESLNPQNDWLLRFPPFEGAFAVAPSWAVPHHVWFVNPNQRSPYRLPVGNVVLDPARSVAVGGRVFVAAPTELVSFGVNAVAQQGTIVHQFAGGMNGPALNRPLYRFGRVFIQKAAGLISRGV